jgi:hypothetical protein
MIFYMQVLIGGERPTLCSDAWSLGKILDQGVTKRCRLSWLTSSALVYEPKCGEMGGGGVAESKYSCTWSLSKL